jgi:hypothetical protein
MVEYRERRRKVSRKTKDCNPPQRDALAYTPGGKLAAQRAGSTI